MASPEKLYRWTWGFKAPPGALWHFVSDTVRFNRDCGFPPFQVRDHARGDPPAEPGVSRLRAVYCGIVAEWEEREFEWVQPVRFSVSRVFTEGPFARMLLSCELSARPGGGTTMVYETRVMTHNLLGALIVSLWIGIRMRRTAERVFRHYDELAFVVPVVPERSLTPLVTGRARQRLASISSKLVSEARQPAPLVERLCDFLSTADNLTASKMRPYALADVWGAGRRETLDLFLHATRAGMLDLSWEERCPYCRGSRLGKANLSAVSSEAHCESCGVDFTADFDQSVELTFAPNPSVRRVPRAEYCMGGPQMTPHIVAQKRLGPKEDLYMATPFPAGRYRVRAPGLEAQHAFRIGSGGSPLVRIELGPGHAHADEPVVAPDGFLKVLNADTARRLAVVERVTWSDQSVTAAVATSRQTFRDLFAKESLRQGERISVGSITIVFTGLKNSTQLYRDIGDAPAFGRVLNHFNAIREAASSEGGAIVKTMGDAAMAVFMDPAAALRAMRKAQGVLSASDRATFPIALMCGIHQGPCLAIGQNDRLDYFGTTVNVSSQLCALSTGADIVISTQVLRDPGVASLLADAGEGLTAKPDAAAPRGAGAPPFEFWRVTGARI
jgi:class 3 adenylate cyclase